MAVTRLRKLKEKKESEGDSLSFPVIVD